VEQRPAAVRALHTPQIDADLALELGVDRLSQVMAHEECIRPESVAVGLELKDPMPIRLLLLKQRAGRGLNVLFQSARVGAGHPVRSDSCELAWVMISAARLAGPNGTFDRGRQAGICPIAGSRRLR
jgi:hypothetical protein